MAPEQILSRKVDERPDIYAISMILSAFVPQHARPYARGNHMAVIYQHVQGKSTPTPWK